MTYGKRKERGMSSETNIVFGVWMRVWIALSPSPWVHLTQREAEIYPSSRRLWCAEPGCHAKPHARRSWLCCPRWRSVALMEHLLLQSAHGWRGCARRCVWSWAVLRLETFCLHMLTDVHHASWGHCVGSLKFWLSLFRKESHWNIWINYFYIELQNNVNDNQNFFLSIGICIIYHNYSDNLGTKYELTESISFKHFYS